MKERESFELARSVDFRASLEQTIGLAAIVSEAELSRSGHPTRISWPRQGGWVKPWKSMCALTPAPRPIFLGFLGVGVRVSM